MAKETSTLIGRLSSIEGMVGWLVSWFFGLLVGWFVGWLVGWLVGDFFKKEGIPEYFQFTGKSSDKMKLSMIFLKASPRG